VGKFNVSARYYVYIFKNKGIGQCVSNSTLYGTFDTAISAIQRVRELQQKHFVGTKRQWLAVRKAWTKQYN
jgi:hypothetical protein